VVLNAAAMAPDRVEEELFGIEDPAGSARKVGALEEAHGGTLYIDEVADMPLETQSKILRVLVEQKFLRLQGTQKVEVDVRIISSTARDLDQDMRDGRFREDLYHRLNVVPLRVPSLAERRDDIPELVAYFVKQIAETSGLGAREIGDDAIAILQAHDWPGNIRELRNVIERAVVLNAGNSIEAEHLLLTPAMTGGDDDPASASPQGPIALSLAQLERMHIERVLRHTDGNKSRAASILGIERSTLDRKLKRFAKDDR
jgi:two-component system nitrogen regulation response regulator NtrX